MLKWWILGISLDMLLACGSEKQRKDLPFKDKQEYEQTMIESHRAFLQIEKEKIQHYIDSLGIPFTATGTGLRYHIYETTIGDTVKTGDWAAVSYTLTSLSGDTLYKVEEGKKEEFAVDFDIAESGLHEGIKYMKIGERAIFILPAHLAHGITGDQEKIPPQTTLVYNLHLIAKR